MEFLKLPKLFAATLYAVPDYQRDYEWTNAQNTTLLDDVFALRNSTEKAHFFGAIVTVPYEESNGSSKSIIFKEYKISDVSNIKHVVDGQQRLTSFSILAKAINDLIEKDFKEDASFVNAQRRKLEQIYYSNYYKGDYPAPVLILNGNTGYCYNSEILKATHQSCGKNFKGAKRLLAAYKFFINEIPKKCKMDCGDDFSRQQDFYSELVETLLNKVTIVEINCDASADAFQVFDSLNGKGLDLTAADRIKNILMSWAPESTRNQIWDNFTQKIGEDYLAGFFVSVFFYESNRRVSKNRLPEEFKTVYNAKQKNNFDSFIQDLYAHGEIYGMLRSCSTNNRELNLILANLKELKMEQIYVMLMAAIQCYGVDVISGKDYVTFVKTLTKLVVRMQVCEKNMNRLDSYFTEWINRMKKNKETLKDISKRIMSDAKTIVPDDSFKQSFVHFAPADNKISEYYLIQIEEYLRRAEGNRNPVGKGVSVEHIIPRAYALERWYKNESVSDEIKEIFRTEVIESIGNKAVIYGDDNSAANNFDYETKLKIYHEGKKDQDLGSPYETFALIKELVDDYPEKFTHKEVESRAKKMAEIAVKIW